VGTIVDSVEFMRLHSQRWESGSASPRTSSPLCPELRSPACDDVSASLQDLLGLLDLVNVTIQLNVQEAKTRLSQVLAQVEAGEDVVIARSGKPVVRLVPVTEPPPRPVGFVEGTVGDSIFDPLSDDELARWE
jgi:prevent-host-death family protein